MLLVLAVRGEQVDGVGLAEAGGVQIAAQRLLVGEDDDDFLVSRGWGSVFQGESVRPKTRPICEFSKCMLC